MDNQPLPVAPQPGILQQPALPTPVVVTPPPAKPAAPPKHFLEAFFLSFFLGVFGADRFYLGYYVQGALKLLTFGWLGIGAIIDLALVMNGALQPKHGPPLAGYEEYKALARRTVVWITVGAGVFIVVSAVFTFIGIEQAVSHLKSSNISNILSGSSSAGGTSTGGASSSSSEVQSLLGQTGL